MLHPKGWIVGILVLILVVSFAVSPEARPVERGAAALVLPLPPLLEGEVERCFSVESREDFERGDCLQAVRIDLIEGTIDLEQALARLERCAGARADLAALGAGRRTVRHDLLRARLAYGETLEPDEAQEYAELIATGVAAGVSPPAAAVGRLRSAGITPQGIDPRRDSATVARLRADRSLREDFRAVFGESLGADLEALLVPESGRAPPAVVLGATVILPNLPPAVPTLDGPRVPGQAMIGTAIPVPAAAYGVRVASELRALEVARLRYLAAAARHNQQVGSIRSFAASVRPFAEAGQSEGSAEDAARRARAALESRLLNLERRIGVDPLIARAAGESVGLASEIDRGCQAVALRRQSRIRGGAAAVTGLVGAAGVVVLSGATGTMLGGLTIAAALEASVGAYLIARSERLDPVAVATARPAAVLPNDPEFRRFRRPDSEVEVAEGNPGAAAGDLDSWFEDVGAAHELAFLEGDGLEDEEGEEFTEPARRENRIPPVLPMDMPEALRELPPLLDTPELRALREMSLPEIQERLDEFLAGTDPSVYARLAEDADVEVLSADQLIAEARASLDLWEKQRRLSDRFGAFFIQAELERLPQNRRQDVLMRAMGRYLHDRGLYAGSPDVEDLRRRVASRLVTHCRAGTTPGDLALTACADETALSVLLVAALQDAGVDVPLGSVLGIQAIGSRLEAVLYARDRNYVFSLTRGSAIDGVVAPIYHPATFYYVYLLNHQIVPEIDLENHLLIALPNRPMPEGLDVEECEPEDRRGVVGRAVEWVGSMFGVRRVNQVDSCGNPVAPRARSSGSGGGGIEITMPTPRNPVQRGGGGQSGGGGQGGGGSGGGNPLAGAAPSDPASGGSSRATRGEPGGQGDSAQGSPGENAQAGGSDGSSGGAGTQEAGSREGTLAGNNPTHAEAGGQGNEGAGGAAESGSRTTGSGDEGGYAIGNVDLPAGPNLRNIGRETARMAERYDRAPGLRVMPWRLREDQGMMTGSSTRVMYADNARALQRFDADDLFITLTPAEVEAQRRMQEADSYPIFQAEADCASPNLPPRRVFRRAAAGDPGFRYVYCDQDESMVIFRTRSDADAYSGLSAPDRPLFLARLASERLARFERSPEIRRLDAYLADPNVLRGYSRDEIYATVKAAADLLVFQNALESALVQSMNELGPSGIRSHYYEMHRQVLQAPFFIRIAEGVHRLNQRLASDPLQSLAWANAQPGLARQGFFDLYFTVGGMMEWPARWATLQERYGEAGSARIEPPSARASLDFLQIMSDPSRVQVDWLAERPGNPSIRDRRMQDGLARSPDEKAEPTLATEIDRQDEVKHLRGGTGGLGRAGEGDSLGPERGRKPIQMVLIRIQPDTGDPDHERLPDDNRIRPGGTEGYRRQQTEESASRQEPMLWVNPETFIEAILSTWDSRDLEPATATRIPPVLRFNERLRDLFLQEMRPSGVYDNRLRAAMEVFTRFQWLRFAEVRGAMGGSFAAVKAYDTGRFSGAYGGNPPINDQDQIRIPNFFTNAGVVIPADLYAPVREHYSRSILGIFDLAQEGRVPPAASLGSLPVPPGSPAEQSRGTVLRTLELIRQQALEAN